MRPSTAGSGPQQEIPATAPPASNRLHLLPLVLLLLAVFDLRTELVLLIDHFTLSSLLTALMAHPLAVVVLLAQPSLWRRYGAPRR